MAKCLVNAKYLQTGFGKSEGWMALDDSSWDQLHPRLTAVDLPRSRDKTVVRVAIEFGYRSPGQFVAAFRRAHGQSPRQFRR
jgi:AraC-like DNA-binding protein